MTRVVVIGNGMAGSRLVEELLRRDPTLEVTVFGAEQRPAYNRILLSDVLAGKRPAADVTLTSMARARRFLGSEVAGIDRVAKTVSTADGIVAPYDVLVLATGSDAIVPPVHGIAGPSGQLLDGVFVFRTLEDCDAIAARAKRSTQAVVVGGGLLGLEAARGLLQHGLGVDVVHGMAHLMDVQLDGAGGGVLRRSVENLGVGVHLGSFASRVLGSRSVTGVGLADGREVKGDLVVLACGVRPNVGVARSAGLAVERGVLVDDQLRTDDPSVYALGECAQHRGEVYGLVAPAWEQATVLADVLTGRSASYTGSRLITRLKAMDLEVAAMGDTRPGIEDCDDELEVVVYADPVRYVYKKLVIRNGVLTGALLLGDTSTAGVVSQAFDRGSALPEDRSALLFAPRRSAAVELTDDAVVCTCNAVTAAHIRESGCTTVPEVALKTRATTGCGGCTSVVKGLLASCTPALERTVA
ncbi:MAG: NAD(P)/FAD-dependent oxidoreductase [Frankiales bacterium]|nr:NAD(P)/FAD-dependent oxidoreductase [Frankiales bacterium]